MPNGAFRGVYPILAMPFDDAGRIDPETLQREVENVLARKLLAGEVHDGQTVTVDYAGGEMVFTAA